MKIIYFTLIMLSTFSISNAQDISTLFESDSIKIIGTNTTGDFCHKVTNLDNDGFWSRIGNSYIHYDDDINIIDTITNLNIDLEFKYRNSLYSLLYSYHDGIAYFDEDSSIGFPYTILDSINLVSFNIENRELSYKNIDTNAIDSSYYQYIFLKNRGLFAVASLGSNNILKLSLIDTSGNVLSSNTYNKNTSGFSIAEQGNNIVICSRPYNDRATIYYIDNNSLIIVDSMDGNSNYVNLKGVNDSIMVGTNIGGLINIYNTQAKTVSYLGYWTDASEGLPTHVIDWNIDGKYPDSIVFCYRRYDYSNSSHLGIVISNFSASGMQNYEYNFNDFEPNAWKLIHGINCTNDGGVIINVNTRTNNPFVYLNAYLLKFYPNGTSNIVSINPDKVVIIAYPNPTKDFINISSSSLIKEIQVYNTLGQEVYSSKANDKHKQINVSNFAKGNYIAKIQTDNGDVTKKFIVE